MTSVFSADDDDGACEIAQQTLCDKRASTGTLYRYQQTQNRGLLVELCRIDPELTANYLPPSD